MEQKTARQPEAPILGITAIVTHHEAPAHRRGPVPAGRWRRPNPALRQRMGTLRQSLGQLVGAWTGRRLAVIVVVQWCIVDGQGITIERHSVNLRADHALDPNLPGHAGSDAKTSTPLPSADTRALGRLHTDY
ncbi:hypothetical protein [Stenotrophomonas sp. Iso1]|uniref:hypothetical protein n=1 Tax=Stenotrophomonas sp. Iso1 TaxID=2977283 RepID=UPI0022B7C9E2|nr:hypothetical protein [Stenotrophomonas sp. Iso1]